jgi:hypothetical protein
MSGPDARNVLRIDNPVTLPRIIASFGAGRSEYQKKTTNPHSAKMVIHAAA